MPTLLTEQPWIIGTIGAILSIVTLFGWFQTGNPVAMKSGIGLLIATFLLILLNVWIVTDSENLRVWISTVADELQANQVEKVLARIHPEASDRVVLRKMTLKSIKFSTLRVTKIHSIEVKNVGKSMTANIRMNVFAEGNIGGMEGKVPRWISLSLEKMGTQWLVADIEEREPLHEFRNSPQ